MNKIEVQLYTLHFQRIEIYKLKITIFCFTFKFEIKLLKKYYKSFWYTTIRKKDWIFTALIEAIRGPTLILDASHYVLAVKTLP